MKFPLRFFFLVQLQIAVKSLTRMHDVLTDKYRVMAEEEKLSGCKISTETVYNTHKTHTKYALSIYGRPKLMQAQKTKFFSNRKPE